jgi:hypothetical protein
MIVKKLSIAGKTIKTYFVPVIDEGKSCGESDFDKNIINIDKNLCKEQKEETWLHEVLHFVFNAISPELSDEEHIVRHSSEMLYHVIKQIVKQEAGKK